MTRTKSSTRGTSRTKSLRSTPARSTSRSRSRSSGSSRRSTNLLSSIPSWVPISLGVAGVCGLVYGLMQLDSVNDFMDPMIHDVGEFFGLTEDEGIDSINLTHDRTYSGIGV